MDLYRAKEPGGKTWLIGSVLQVSESEMYMLAAGPMDFERPAYNAMGIGCGLEDRYITDRYEAAAYGWEQACERFEENSPTFVRLDPETVCKSTGFSAYKKDDPDGDRSPIFEGDILKFAVFDYNGLDTLHTGVVRFAEGEWQLWHDKDSEYYSNDGAFSLFWVLSQDDEAEIIGNIFDEPEVRIRSRGEETQ